MGPAALPTSLAATPGTRMPKATRCSKRRKEGSLIVSRTGRGEDLVRRTIEAGYIMAQNLDVTEIAKMQPSQAKRKRLVLSRLCAMALTGRVMPRFVGLRLCKSAFGASFWQNLRSFLGMARRLLQGRARYRNSVRS